MANHVQDEWEKFIENWPAREEIPEAIQVLKDAYFAGAAFVSSKVWELAHTKESKVGVNWVNEVRNELIDYIKLHAERLGVIIKTKQ